MSEILLIYITCMTGALSVGLAIGYFVGQSMTNHRVSSYIEHNPFAPCYELGDELFPEKMPEIIEIPDSKKWADKSSIVRKHWGKIRNLNAVILVLFMTSCATMQRIPSEPVGTVTLVDGNFVKVSYVIIEKDQVVGMAVNWYYYRQGHSYVINDRYPACYDQSH